MLLLLLHAVYSLYTDSVVNRRSNIPVKPQEQPSVSMSCLIPNLLFIDSEPLAFALVVSKLNSITYL